MYYQVGHDNYKVTYLEVYDDFIGKTLNEEQPRNGQMIKEQDRKLQGEKNTSDEQGGILKLNF